MWRLTAAGGACILHLTESDYELLAGQIKTLFFVQQEQKYRGVVSELFENHPAPFRGSFARVVSVAMSFFVYGKRERLLLLRKDG